MPADDIKKPVLIFYRLAQVVHLIPYRLFFGFRSFGAENVPDDGRGVILAPNHASFLDPPAVAIAVWKPSTFLAKDYLFQKPLLGRMMRWLGILPIKTASEDIRSIRQLLRILKGGGRVVVFPEGTRSLDGRLQDVKEQGIGFLALKSKAYVVPVYVQGTYEVLPRGAKGFRRHPVRVHIGKAFLPGEDKELLAKENPYLAASQRIMDEIKKIKEEVD